MIKYDVSSWYWNVGGNSAQLWSSAAVTYVPTSNTTYQQWLAMSGVATNIDSAQSLVDVLATQWLPLQFSKGVPVTCAINPLLNGTYLLDPVSMQYVTSVATSIAAGRGLPGGSSIFVFNGVIFDATTFLNLAAALESYVYNLTQGLAARVLTGNGSLPATPLTI